ncbi:probable methyltransferase-like protein 24 [Biomphalaria glabrata]|uniref:Probable methyltransferase-like protein 24 n=1 Tax=Biomphalaria glabrata TaxID=6526 RepID=A0A9W3AM18_BIOGL|nr:probable methyltransferase-like protein 24 [Biomphalaria glabrata]
MFDAVKRNYIKILFPLTAFCLCLSLYHNYTVIPMPDSNNGNDLCIIGKDRLFVNKDNEQNLSRQWWEWACLLEKEWDKGAEYSCKDIKLIGNYKICFDEPYKPSPPCLVYSFGIDNDFRFDDAMAEIGCEVFSFDPSMGVEDHQRSERVRFLNLGIATFDSDNFMPLMDGYTLNSKKTWKIRTLSSIKKMLGHEKRALDILKIDVETYEWEIMKDLVKNGSLQSVKQLTLEWHIFANEPMRTEFPNMYGTYMNLKKIGFQQFYSSYWARYHTFQYFNSQEDNSLVNTQFKL